MTIFFPCMYVDRSKCRYKTVIMLLCYYMIIITDYTVGAIPPPLDFNLW